MADGGGIHPSSKQVAEEGVCLVGGNRNQKTARCLRIVEKVGDRQRQGFIDRDVVEKIAAVAVGTCRYDSFGGKFQCGGQKGQLGRFYLDREAAPFAISQLCPSKPNPVISVQAWGW